ncbi:hypothetical protein GFS31_29100 [Leptolyngbya sp. BL0902]|uniref:hypothetical protein n=1 Tax=Leptolyngbya sp. BL0902 TaxID=1115757 RepID=UPI0019377F2B|nr:hypothetical protein [Leptolyngbya sp. BL0902]QQE66212.1 hypothetical protein GFS31_29100 [Leptolyngbya sp. BL0902]
MANKSAKKRLFDGMGYRELQSSNTQRRKLLSKIDQDWLRQKHYKNVGWENVIQLHRKINAFLATYQEDDVSLEDLFLEADRIGSRYQTSEEINGFHQTLSETMESIAQKIDQFFPDEEPEMIDFRPRQSRSSNVIKSKKRKR